MSSIALQLPTNYVEFEREEMEYIDGGWEGNIFVSNMRGIYQRYGKYLPKGSSGAWRFAGGAGAAKMAWSYWTTVSELGGEVAGVAAAAAEVGGPIAVGLGCIAGVGGATAIWYLGNHRKFY